MIVVQLSPIVFGEQPDLAIPGYVVICKPRDFAIARRDGVDHFICDHPDRWELWRIDYRDDAKSPRNPTGQTVAEGEAIVVRKP